MGKSNVYLKHVKFMLRQPAWGPALDPCSALDPRAWCLDGMCTLLTHLQQPTLPCGEYCVHRRTYEVTPSKLPHRPECMRKLDMSQTQG